MFPQIPAPGIKYLFAAFTIASTFWLTAEPCINLKLLIIHLKNNYIQYRAYLTKANHYKFIGEREKYLLIKRIPKEVLKNLSKLKKKTHKHQQQGITQMNQAIMKYEVDNISWNVLFLSRKHRKINSVGSYS